MVCNFYEIENVLVNALKKPKCFLDIFQKRSNKQILKIIEYYYAKNYRPIPMDDPTDLYNNVLNAIHALYDISMNFHDIAEFGVFGISKVNSLHKYMILFPIYPDDKSTTDIGVKLYVRIDEQLHDAVCIIDFSDTTKNRHQVTLCRHPVLIEPNSMCYVDRYIITELNNSLHIGMCKIIRYAYKMYT